MTSVLRQLPLRFRRTFLPLLTVVAMLGSTLGISAAFAVAGTDGGGFEIDGNYASDETARDWDDVGTPAMADYSGLEPIDVNGDGFVTASDQDDVFVAGNSAKENDRANWAFEFETGSGNDKLDLNDIWIDVDDDPAGGSYLRFGFERDSGNGDAWVAFELNQLGGGTVTDLPPATPMHGDLLVAYFYQGQGQTISVDVTVYEWDSTLNGGAGDWDEVEGASTLGAVFVSPPTTLTSPIGETITDRAFGEGSVDLSFLFDDAEDVCRNFGQVSVRSRSSESDEANLYDIVRPFPLDIDTCGSLEIEKQDEDENVLDGATFAVYDVDGTLPDLTALAGADGVLQTSELAGLIGDATLDELTGSPCTTPNCYFDALPESQYLAVETQAPAGYGLSSPNWQVEDLAELEDAKLVFVNPRLPYSIDVTPETDTNPVGLDHDFLVTATEDGQPVAAGTEIALDWSWDVAPDPDQPGITAVNGVDIANTNSTTCTTQDNVAWGGGTVDGACVVTVTSYGSAASGTLKATLDLPYQGGTGTAGPTLEGPTVADGSVNLDTIFDEGDKVWRGYRVDIDEPATNLAGDPHTFTVTVTEFGPGGDEAADGVIVSATWASGPAGSTIVGDPDTPVPGGVTADAACTTDTSGQCDFIVDSDDSGTGDLTIVALNGQIGDHAVAQTTFTAEDDIDTAKTWIEYRLWVTPDADINQVGWEHPFTVHVQSNDGSGWAAVEGATFSDGPDPDDIDFSGDLVEGDLTIDTSDCETGTDVNGECDITATSTTTGSTTLTISGVTVPFDGGTHLTLSDTALSATDGNGEDNDGTKTWIDYGVTIGDDGTNLLGEPHPFTVAVTRSDIGALEGATVHLTWDGPAGSIIYPAGQPGSPYVDGNAGTDGAQFTCTTDAAGECDFEVDSDSGVGTGTLSVTKVEDNSGDVTDGGSVTFQLGEKDTTKTWIAVDLDISDSATNLTGEDHLFTVTATLFDGDPVGGEDLPVTGATLCISVSGSVGSVVGATAGDGDPCALDEYEVTSTTDGEFEVTVTSNDPGSLTVTLESVHFSYDGNDFSVDLTEGEDGYTPDAESSVEATKTWIAVDLDISGDSTNLVGSEHTFDVTALVFDGDPEAGEDLPVTGAMLCISIDGSVGSVVGAGPGDGVPCALDEYEITSATDGEFEITVDSDDPGSLTVTLESVHFSWNGTSFSVDLTSGSDGYQPGDGSDIEATKTWISYALAITPQDATNLLPTDPDHPLTVTLSSEGGAPTAGQTLDLSLTSDNGALVTAVDADGDGDLDALDPEATTAECVTDALGQCLVEISADTPGSATLSASFTFTSDDGEHTIESGDFPSQLEGDENGQDADKTWTTYVVTVNGPAINLLGSPHTFTVHVQQTFDGENFADIEGEVFGTAPEDGSYITISDLADPDVASITGGTCFEEPGTDTDGECTVIVESTATTIATVTAYFEGTASESQSSLFYDENTKQWIDYRLDVTPDTADNLVDTDHVFTVTVEVDLGDGEGWQAVPDGSEVALALTGVGTIISTGDGGTIDEGGMGGTCVTDGGTCEVVIRSAVAGQSSLVATYTGIATNGELVNVEESADFSNEETPAVKNWVDYELVMDEDAVNPIGTTHTFTATLTVDTGEGFGPAAGEEVDFTISGVGTVVEVENGTVDEDARGGTCETDEDGNCDIIIASNEVGATTVTATYGAVVGETSRDFSDSAVKTWVSNPAIDLVKDVDKTTAGIGELVTYTYTITNTGDVTLTNVQLIDEVTITGAFDQLLELIGAAGAITLEPGESTSLTSTHLVTEADLPGPIDNVATVTGEAPDGTEVSDTDDETVDPFGLPAISLNKEADLPGDDGGIKSVGVDPDDPDATVIEYGFVIVNEGNVTLTDVTLQDFVLSELPSGGGTLTFDNATSTVDGDLLSVTIADTTLSPGESTTGTLLFAVRSGDVDLGLITNVAEVTGTAPDDTTVSDEDIENVALVLPDVVPPPPAPAPVLPKTGAEFTDILLWALLTAGLGFALLLVSPPGRLAPRRRRRD